ncbi:hypothetical protein, partial [Aquisphaera insulae]|uniref:hypothetical protein n=1 Tax=Aquisphaera insulae TaxID=2712864 RepID=UPI00196A3C68
LSGSAGLDVVVSPDRGNAALYAYAGAALVAGSSSNSTVGFVGGLFGIHNSSAYEGVRARISVGLYQLPVSLRGPIKNALLQVALAAARGAVAPLNTGSSVGGSLDFVRQIGRANARLAVAINQLVNNSGISIDFPIGDPSGPIGISLAINFTGASAFQTRKYGNAATSFSVATYLQLYPSKSVGL